MTFYEEVVKAWGQEQSTSELQPLKAGFFKEAAGYVKRLREASRNLDQKSLKATVIRDELERFEKLVGQLIDIRLEKAWNTARGGGVTLAPDTLEKQSFEGFSEITRFYTRLKEDVAAGREPQRFEGAKKERLTVRFLKDVPSIVGMDLKTYGPFQKEDVAVVPYENAETLIRQGAAAEVAAALLATVPGDNG